MYMFCQFSKTKCFLISRLEMCCQCDINKCLILVLFTFERNLFAEARCFSTLFSLVNTVRKSNIIIN